ncbi:MAG: glycosyltransferase [Nitrospirae bacterium]|nr:glycosyltransferase [Nitrospirota bacterium]
MTNKYVAVITPMRNAKDTILLAMQSVAYQSVGYGGVKHFIYDDASCDKSSDSVRNFIKLNPLCNISIVENSGIQKGQSHGRNELISRALSEGYQYIAFLDADDVWNFDHLEVSRENVFTCDVSYSIPKITDGINVLKPYGITVPKVFIGKQLELNNYIWISGVMARAKCFRDEEFDSNLDSIEDWDMWYRLFKRSRIFKCTGKQTFKYLVRKGGSAAMGGSKLDLLRKKHGFKLNGIKLNLACGDDYREDYINVDFFPKPGAKIDSAFDVKIIPYEDNSVDEVRASHIIEHFDFHEIPKILEEWYRVLKPGGKLFIETPDFLESCRAFVSGDENFRILLYGHFFAMPWENAGMVHKFLFTENQLRTNLGWAKFRDMRRVEPQSWYVRPDTYKLFLAMEAIK